MTPARFQCGGRHRRFPFSALVTCSVLMVTVIPAVAQDSPRIVVVGEIQGAANSAATLLGKTGLIDGEGHWSGGDSVLIQT
ncbi:MAG: hypothetical protein MUP13_02280, partial [Thermoanaerobaculales bacterium]|nr:hypothetical protein [Thermoanaerobaculales bacterium]